MYALVDSGSVSIINYGLRNRVLHLTADRLFVGVVEYSTKRTKRFKMTNSITNKKQMAKLVELMQKNPDISKGLCTRKQTKERWEHFANILNSLGPPMKRPDKWARVWVDLKSNTKRKIAQKRAELCANNEEQSFLSTLNPLDAAIVEFLDFNNSTDPQEENGVYYIIEDEDDSSAFSNLKEEEVKSANEATASSFDDNRPVSPPLKRKTKFSGNVKTSRMALLEAHTKEKQKFHKDICRKLDDIASALNTVRCQQEEHQKIMLSIEREKLKLSKENNEKNEKYRAEKLQILRRIKK